MLTVLSFLLQLCLSPAIATDASSVSCKPHDSKKVALTDAESAYAQDLAYAEIEEESERESRKRQEHDTPLAVVDFSSAHVAKLTTPRFLNLCSLQSVSVKSRFLRSLHTALSPPALV